MCRLFVSTVCILFFGCGASHPAAIGSEAFEQYIAEIFRGHAAPRADVFHFTVSVFYGRVRKKRCMRKR